MATIGIATSPAIVSADFQDSVTTASFNAASETVLVAMAMGSTSGGGTMSVSGGGLTWTRRAQRAPGDTFAEIWTAPCASGATGITVTATLTGAFTLALKVDVVTGAKLSAPAGQTGSGATTTNTATVVGYTSSQAGSRGFCAALEGEGLGTPSSTDDEAAFDRIVDGMAVRKAANTATAGTSVTFNLDAAGTGTAGWQWAALEILPGSTDAEATPSTVAATATTPAVTISAGQTAAPGTVAASAAVPQVSVRADQTAAPGTVVAAASVPQVTITTGSVTVISAATVAAVASVAAPGLSAGQTAAPAAVAAAAAVPQVTISAQRQTVITPETVAVLASVPELTISVPVLPGDSITADGQIEWNGALWGGTGIYRVVDLSGWDELPDIDSGNVARPSGHGSYPGRKLARERFVSAVILVEDRSSGFPSSLQAVFDATPVLEDETEYPLAIRTRGEPRWVSGAVVGRLSPPDLYGAGVARVAIRWACSDPRLYGLVRHGTTVPLDEPTELLNAGNIATQPILRIPGPVTNPRLECDELERVIEFAVEVEEDSRLDIDIKAGTALIGSTSVIGDISGSVPLPDWVLGPGVNTISFTADAGGTGGADILWYDAWI